MPRNSRQFAQFHSPGQRCLVLGVLGAGMTAAAEILRDAGHYVVGMDRQVDYNQTSTSFGPCNELRTWSCDDSLSFDMCVASPAVPGSDEVLQQVRKSGTPILRLPQFLATMFAGRRQLCVAGTHGKSTTASMLNCILQEADFNPGCFVGAHQTHTGCSGRFTDSQWAVIESCEFSESFLEYSPQVAVLTGIERDHFDCFPDCDSESRAFQSFLSRVPTDGTVVYSADCQRSHAAMTSTTANRKTFRVVKSGAPADTSETLTVSNVRLTGMESISTVSCEQETAELRLFVPGRHNVKNAAAAIAAATTVGVPLSTSCAALQQFAGLRRRFDIRGLYNGVLLVDDYAHHPTAVRETLLTAKVAFPDRRVIAAFEPHQIVRTKALFAEFFNALTLADEVYLLPVFPARESASALDCCRLSGQLVKELNNVGSKAFLFASLDQIVSRIDHSARASDVFLTMGAGRINLIHDQLNRRLQRHSVA